MASKQAIDFNKTQYIDGRWCVSQGFYFTSVNPANNQMIWEGNYASEREIDEAVYAAERALPVWASLTLNDRIVFLKKFAEEVEAKRQELARLISMETGKPFWESLTEVSSVVGKIALSIQAYGERTESKSTVTADATACLRYKPHGVVVVLGAFNFPAHLSNGHIVPALLAGNTILYKPSELTPAVATFITQCWHDAELPAGVFNCIQGNGETARLLLSKDIQGVYFTGSYQTGKRIHQQFGERPEVILALEMGGNNPLVVDEISNCDAAVYNTILSSFLTAGQRCTCARRLMVKNGASGDAFIERLLTLSKQLRIGAFDQQPEPFMGPVIRREHAIAHITAQEKLLAIGGKPLLLMQRWSEDSALLSPGIIDMTHSTQPEDEEIFAPLVQIYRYDDFDQAVHLANQTRYGLSAGLFSDNEQHYQEFYRRIRAGLINWNRPTTGAASSLPFGGVGCSGNHRPSAYFAADYCAYPIASMEKADLTLPAQLLPGIIMD